VPDLISVQKKNLLNSVNKLGIHKKIWPPLYNSRSRLKRSDILTSFNDRVNNDSEKEFSTAMEEVHKIARLRLEQLSL